MTQGKRISSQLEPPTLQTIRSIGNAAKSARLNANEGQATAATRLGVHVQTIGRIEAGEPGVAIGHVLGMLGLYGVTIAVDGPPA